MTSLATGLASDDPEAAPADLGRGRGPAGGQVVGHLPGRLEELRRELTGYCYRMLASTFDAEDAVQDTMIRAWRSLDRFDGRSTLRTWVYRIATNVCLDMLAGRRRRALPIDLGPASVPVERSLGQPLPEATWVEPIPDVRVLPESTDPAELAIARESIRLAFVIALQHLPPRQRAVLILRDVLRWKADEVAELLDTTVASANSALQRARTTMAAKHGSALVLDPMDDVQRALLGRYVDAFERYDIESLVSLLHEDATQTMPPYDLWLRGPADIARWLAGPGSGCEGSVLVPVEASGLQGYGQYRPSGPGGRHEPFAIHVVEVSGGRIAQLTHFIEPKLFAVFGLPDRIEPRGDR